MAEGFRNITKDDIKYLTTLLSISEEEAQEYFLKNSQNSFFIKRSGLLALLDKRYGSEGYSINVEVPGEDELASFNTMLGEMKSPFVIMKATVTLHKSGRSFTEYASATTSNTNAKTRNYLVEMASTRSSNRAMRLCLASPFTSDSELALESDVVEVEEKPKRTTKKREASKEVKNEPKQSEPSSSIERKKMIEDIHSIRTDYGYSDAQLNKSIEQIFGAKKTLDNLSDNEVKTLYEKMLSLKSAA